MNAVIHRNQLPELFKTAFSCHQTGDLSNAETRYEQILMIDPDHSDALHLLGLIKHKKGDIRDASLLIDKAVAVAPDFPNYHISLGDVYADMGALDKAVSQYQTALRLDPNLCEAYFNMGNALSRINDFDSAILSYEKALRINPNLPDALNNMGLIFHIQKNLDRAVSCFKKALEINPKYADSYSNLGNSLFEMGLEMEAIAAYERAIALDPNHFDAHYNLGNFYHSRRVFGKALSYYHNALILKPDHVDVHINLGKTYHVKGDPEKAFLYYEKAAALTSDMPELDFYMGNALLDQLKYDLALECYSSLIQQIPTHVDALINMGIAFYNKGCLDDAVRCYKRALDVDPHNVKAFNNLGKTFRDQLDLKNAFLCYQRAIELNPEYVEAHSNNAFCLLLSGRFKEGWQEYEWRLQEKNIFPQSDTQSQWNGTPLPNKSILVYAEQGIGDEIMFSSCLPDLTRCVARCFVECDKRLIPLFERSFPGIKFIRRHAIKNESSFDIPAADVKVALGSLPLYFRNHMDDFPKQCGYLIADPIKIQKWHKRFQSLGNGLCIGISWRAGKQQNTGRLRSIELTKWDDLFSISGIHLINLQYGPCEDELEKVFNDFGIIVHRWQDADPLKDMDDFAAQIAALDLVISVDNSTVHLAGSLGIPVWTLLPYSPDWRWMMDCENTPWYESMRLFRQRCPGNWTGVFRKIKTELEKVIDHKNII